MSRANMYMTECSSAYSCLSDDGDVKSSTVVKTCTNESVLNSNHRLAVEIKVFTDYLTC